MAAEQAAPEVMAQLIRQPWGMDNKVHWVRAAVWREDDQHAHAGSSVQVMDTLRNLALGLMRLAGTEAPLGPDAP